MVIRINNIPYIIKFLKNAFCGLKEDFLLNILLNIMAIWEHGNLRQRQVVQMYNIYQSPTWNSYHQTGNVNVRHGGVF